MEREAHRGNQKNSGERVTEDVCVPRKEAEKGPKKLCVCIGNGQTELGVVKGRL